MKHRSNQKRCQPAHLSRRCALARALYVLTWYSSVQLKLKTYVATYVIHYLHTISRQFCSANHGIRPRPVDRPTHGMPASPRTRHEDSLRYGPRHPPRRVQHSTRLHPRHHLRRHTRPVLGPARTPQTGRKCPRDKLHLHGMLCVPCVLGLWRLIGFAVLNSCNS